MRIRAVYVVTILVVLIAVSASAFILIGIPWMEPAQAVSEAVSVEPGVIGQVRGLDAQPLKSNAETKGDRLPVSAPALDNSGRVGPASLSLESARLFLIAPTAGVKFRTVMRAKQTTVLLDDKQIAAIKQRLKLTKAQERYWPPVESALRDLVLYLHSQRGQPIPKVLDANSEQVKRMLAVGMPFLAQLREDQKSQIQALAHIAGLGTELPGLKEAQN